MQICREALSLPGMADLFADDLPPPPGREEPRADAPLADRLRPRALDDVVGQEHLTTAATMYREMDMGFWVTKVEVELCHP